jgi:hypothetical protein
MPGKPHEQVMDARKTTGTVNTVDARKTTGTDNGCQESHFDSIIESA